MSSVATWFAIGLRFGDSLPLHLTHLLEATGDPVRILKQQLVVRKLHRVPKKHLTTFSTITLTISVRLQ